jgi:ribonuclease HI
MLDGRRMLLPALLRVSGDSMLVVSYVTGLWRVGYDCEFTAQVKRSRWLLYALQYGWKFEAWTCDEPVLVQRPRSQNGMADALCNFALDAGDDTCVQKLWGVSFDPRGCPIHVSFDGASRGNPGPAAVGAVVQIHHAAEWHVVGAFACCIGRATNNGAEFEALVAVIAWGSMVGIAV